MINYSFCLGVWRNFIRWNSERYNRKIRIDTPVQILASIANKDSSERLSQLAKAFAYFRPFAHKMKDGSEFYLPLGLMLSGLIKGRDAQGGLLVESGKRVVEIHQNYVSVLLHHAQDPVGEQILFAIRGKNFGTCRGKQFVENVIEIFFPAASDTDNPVGVVLGASNSWAVLQTSEAKVSRLVAGQGVYLQQLREICGLRRVTAIKKAGNVDAMVHDFCRTTWRELAVERQDHGSYLLSLTARGEAGNFDPRKYRTFSAMWKKILPGVSMNLRYRREEDENWTFAFSDRAPQ
ncbi:hypothetical protein QA649_27060 [Bradyrhizobium sp. CB1717]|uniref:hypothetical protein n=1 Tax=Bradyrhizobium sp. CB1717 TaxID=3039154 RepID=UPI0024B24A2C|nr:hypothetical protein [Bradyrhizobium sp. CB1717]WFU21756.1 hypothetical protein QA649_27060 [Bradyrhizobium sp. CB1717]